MSIIRYRNLMPLPTDLNQFFGNFGLDFWNTDSIWSPSVDVIESENGFEIKAEIPGVEKDEIKISVEDHVLTLSGERKHEKEEKDKNYHRIERSYGKFQRAFQLPNGVQSDAIDANYVNGILTIRIPKSEEVKPKEISIQ